MKLSTWNVNSLTVRLPQVVAWLNENPMDALCLQELKQTDDKVQVDAFKDIGYHIVFTGQKTYNGVAIISKSEPRDVQRNIPGFDDPQQRVIAATIDSPQGDVRLISAYCPNGQAVGSDKYDYKLTWYKAFTAYVRGEMAKFPRLAVLGDYNIAPDDRDVHDPAKWEGQVLVSEPEREAFRTLLALGLSDSFRLFEQEPKLFSWWDYRMMGFRRNAGLRIDHILVTDTLKAVCSACVIDKKPRRNEQPSDHTPVVATLDL